MVNAIANKAFSGFLIDVKLVDRIKLIMELFANVWLDSQEILMENVFNLALYLIVTRIKDMIKS